MDETVSAAPAKRTFFRILRGVTAGRSYLVTFRGVAVARIVPAQRERAATDAAKAALLNRLHSQPVTIIGEGWSRKPPYT
jgi:antitoxin (DNA-binding transcriptional repressor) of toxin-antitoxin stability system